MSASLNSSSVGTNEMLATVRFPESPLSASERSVLLDHAYEEYCELVDRGEEIDPDEFCGRFPAFQTSLRRLVQAHQHLEENPALLRELTVRWPEAGESFLGYRMLSELGRGAFARVYLAQEVAVGGRLVAVKLSLHDDHEADTLGRLQHPNVVPIYSTQHDAGSGFTFVCMPFLGGTTLCHVIDHAAATERPRRSRVLLEAARDARWPGDNAPLPNALLARGSYIDGVLHVAERLASALAYVHDEGVVHRDLKPSNILMCPNGVPLLLDFNLALDRVVHDYRLGGTLPYMPPEQLQAIEHRKDYRAAAADAWTDLYGLGVILFELVGRAHPYGPVPAKLSTLEARDWLLERLKLEPRSIRELNPECDRRLGEFVTRCIARDPKDRPATAHEMVEELRRFQSLGRRARRWTVANWKSVTAAGVLALVPAGAFGHFIASLPPVAVRQLQAGDEHSRQGRLTAAAAAYTQSLDADADQPNVYFARGRAHMLLGQFEKAVHDFRNSDVNRKNGRTLACTAYCLAQLDQHGGATQLNSEAMQKGFRNAEVLSNLAYSQLRLALYEDAIESANAALAIDDKLPEALLSRAMGRLQIGQYPDNPQLKELAYLDIQNALAGGLVAPETFLKAARIAEYYRRTKPERFDVSANVETWTRAAIERGCVRKYLENDLIVGAIAKALPPAIGATPYGAPIVRDGLVDPLVGD